MYYSLPEPFQKKVCVVFLSDSAFALRGFFFTSAVCHICALHNLAAFLMLPYVTCVPNSITLYFGGEGRVEGGGGMWASIPKKNKQHLMMY
jgi:hypothetical protein